MCIVGWFFSEDESDTIFLLAFNRDEELDRGTIPAEKMAHEIFRFNFIPSNNFRLR
ncbi:hypothetical protein DSO57_1027959 [Entomophthora muscae]|uniref:Uncharacterized protein n=1 Tax=Entomophthora muscae TaxID=34485 RepID=A0ACC2TCI4_9FUNG|nr:hypothetical protein DSO57_1027959 [Entomophthora muscae]